MANDLAGLTTKLETALRDPSNATWAEAELQDLLTWSCASIWPKVARRIREIVTLADDDDQYTLSTLAEVNRVDLLDEDDLLEQVIPGGAWEFWGDGEGVGDTLYINPVYAFTGKTLRVHGYGPYDLVTNLPEDRHVPLILAKARVEAARREIARRQASKNWQTLNQVQNISVNELVLMVNEADAEAQRLEASIKTWRRPKPARVG